MIYGPPGAGKSTLIQHLPHHGLCVAIDLEAVGPRGSFRDPGVPAIGRAIRKSLVEQMTRTELRGPLFFGCGNLWLADFPSSSKIIYLHHEDEGEYMKWLERRERQVPGSANQDCKLVYDHMTGYLDQGVYDFVVRPADFRDRIDEMAKHVWDLVATASSEREETSSPHRPGAKPALDVGQQIRQDLRAALVRSERERDMERVKQKAERGEMDMERVKQKAELGDMERVKQKAERELAKVRARLSSLKKDHKQLKSRCRELDRQFAKTFRSRLLAIRMWWRVLRKGVTKRQID